MLPSHILISMRGRRSCLSLLGSEIMEIFNFEVLDNSVELFLGILILVSAAGDSDADSAGDVSDTVDPDSSVETVIDSHILGEHLLLGETFDVSNATGSSLLELDTLESLVEVESVVSASGLHFFSLSVF